MGEVFFTADTHFNHKLMAKQRGFVDVPSMNQALIKLWNECVSKNDTVYHLGDFAYPVKKACEIEELVSALNGNIILVRGNHDYDEHYANKKVRGFTHYGNSHEDMLIKLHGKLLYLSHYAQLVWDRSHYGVWNLHGHSHGKLEYPTPFHRAVDVGVDNRRLTQLVPVSWGTLASYMAEKEGCV